MLALFECLSILVSSLLSLVLLLFSSSTTSSRSTTSRTQSINRSAALALHLLHHVSQDILADTTATQRGRMQREYVTHLPPSRYRWYW